MCEFSNFAVVVLQSRWVPRRVANDPRKIEDIHKDFVEEKQQKLALLSRLPPATPPPDAKTPGGGRGGRGRQDTPDERLSAAASKPIDPTKMKISKQVDVDNIQLGPRMGQNRWSGGSTGGSSVQSFKEDHNGLSTPSRLGCSHGVSYNCCSMAYQGSLHIYTQVDCAVFRSRNWE